MRGGFDVQPVDASARQAQGARNGLLGGTLRTTICGSFSRDLDQIRDDIEGFRRKGVQVLSPKSAEIQESRASFAYVYGDPYRSERAIEDRHLSAILNSDFVWIANADGNPGTASLLELGYAMRGRTPIYSRQRFTDPHLSAYVIVVQDPVAAVRHFRARRQASPSAPNLLLDPSEAIRSIEHHVSQMKHLLALPPNAFLERHEQALYEHWQAVRRIFDHPTLD